MRTVFSIFMLSVSFFVRNVVRTFFMKCRQHFMFSVSYFEKNCVHIFFWWNTDNFGLSTFSKSYPHQYLENKCFPHFLLMKCLQHFNLSACCPVICSCPHFINTPKYLHSNGRKLVDVLVYVICQITSVHSCNQKQNYAKLKAPFNPLFYRHTQAICIYHILYFIHVSFFSVWKL